jgi:transcriptional regulator with XRE-family HTH domain
MTIADRIDHILKEKGISRRKLAVMAKIPPSSLQSAMQRGDDISFKMVTKIAKVLNIDKFELQLGYAPDPHEEYELSYTSNEKKRMYEVRKDFLEEAFDNMNETGQTRAVDLIEDLAKIPEYQKDNLQNADESKKPE